jgi:hypothetical protein
MEDTESSNADPSQSPNHYGRRAGQAETRPPPNPARPADRNRRRFDRPPGRGSLFECNAVAEKEGFEHSMADPAARAHTGFIPGFPASNGEGGIRTLVRPHAARRQGWTRTR